MHSLGGFLVLFHIMCNVVALTFYATIYEDLCCTCNKYIEKAHTSYGELYGFVCVLGVGRGVGGCSPVPSIQGDLNLREIGRF